MSAKRLYRYVAGASTGLMVAGLLVSGSGAAQAAVVGSLTLNPATGSNIQLIDVTSSAPCPTGATNLLIKLTGPGFPAVGQNVSGNAKITSFPVGPNGGPLVALANHFQAFADQQVPPAVLAGNTFTLTMFCQNSFGTQQFGEYVAQVQFTSATSYVTVSPVDNSTSTVISASPATSQVQGGSVTFTANVTAAIPPLSAGSVQFFDGATPLGAAMPVSSGVASLTTSALSLGGHTITAVFTPTAGPQTASTSQVLTYTITAPVPVTTTTTLGVTPAGTAVVGSPVAMTATVSPSNAAGSVQFKDGATNIGAAVAVAAGSAAASTSALTVGTHSLTAVFTPTNATAFTASTSAATSYIITAIVPNPTTTTTALAVSPAGTAVAGSPVALTATLSPSNAVGSVQFKDGATNIGAAVPLAAGSAGASTSALTVGTHSLTAVFTPTDPTAFTVSTSTATSYVITAIVPNPTTTTTALAVSPAGTAVVGSSVSLTATLSPSNAVGSVQFKDGATNIGAAVAVSAGSAAASTSVLTVGTHSLTAVFTPTDPTAFTASTSAATSYDITPPVGPVQTATALIVAPTGSQVAGAAVSLTASVTPAAGGSIQFLDGASPVGAPVAVAAGAASMSTSSLAIGTHSFTAAFTPTDPTAFTSSTSPAVQYAVTAVPPNPTATSTTLSVSPSGTAVAGTAVVLSASVAPAAAGTVQFMDGASNVGAAVSVSAGGSASLTTSALAVGTHSLSAVFAPTDPTAFTGSTSAAVSYIVTSVVPPTGAPVNTKKPWVTGDARYNQLVTCHVGTWTDADSYSYQWFIDGKAVAGATERNRRLRKTDVGAVISCQVTATNEVGSTAAMSEGKPILPVRRVAVAVKTVKSKV